MTFALAVLVTTIAATPSVELTTIAGETVSGHLETIQSGEVTLSDESDSGEPQTNVLPIKSLLAVRFAERFPERFPEKGPPHEVSGTVLHFPAGGRLTCQSVTIKDRTIHAQRGDGPPIAVPMARVAAIRFRQLDAPVAEDWRELLAKAPPRDLLVVRNGDTLDRVEGTVSALSEESLIFLVGESRVSIARDKQKLFAVILAHAPDSAEQTVCDVRLQNGDHLAAAEVAFGGEALSVTTAGGWEISLDASKLSELDFGRQRVRYLSDVEPDDVEHSSYLGGKFDSVFSVRRDHSDAGPKVPIRIAGRTFRKGLVIHSQTTLTYALNGRYQRFVAVAGIEDLVRPLGSVLLTISLDGEQILQETVTGSEAPQPIDLDLEGVRQLRIQVDFADNWDTADHLALGGARLIK